MATDRAFSVGRDFLALFEGGSFAGLTDGQLLERFQDGGGEVAERAFTALLERHGPMVLRTCQRILKNEHDAHDAFQATFLVLVQKGRSLWVRQTLGPWLHRVACRAANRARKEQMRRQIVEREPTAAARDQASPDHTAELLAVLHEELDRLPDRYRSAIVLCDLEGRTCEQTAEQLGCPIGTVGSRLARGREKLRGRLIRRGLAPGAGTVAAALSVDAAMGSVPSSLAGVTARAAMQLSVRASSGALTIASAMLARDISRSMLMTKFRSIAAIILACFSLCVVSVFSYRAMAKSQQDGPRKAEKAPVQLKKQAAAEPENGLRDSDFGNDPVRYKDYLIATIGNSLPLKKDDGQLDSVNRMAVLYRDGTAKLWSFESRDPVCPPLRDKTPIRDIGFYGNAGLLVTVADDSVKLWNGVSGELMKELPGQILRPLSLLSDYRASGRCVTIDTEGKAVSIWDAKRLESVDHFQPKEQDTGRLVGAALSPDGETLVTIAEDRSVSLWDATTKQSYATVRPPSPLSGRVFDDEACPLLKRPRLQIDDRFWEIIEPLKPVRKSSATK